MGDLERFGRPHAACCERAERLHAALLNVLADGRAGQLRLVLFRMRDAREVTAAAGFELTTEAKARLYDMQQDIIRAAIAADDLALDAALRGDTKSPVGTPPTKTPPAPGGEG